jgi:3-phosphoshikimate 1-carboxyvinyltransferase
MADFRIEPSCLKGSVTVPASKSHTMRAILFACLSEGISRIEGYLDSPDVQAMIHAVCLLGAEVNSEGDILHVRGWNGHFRAAEDVIQCGNSGQVLRFVGAVAGLIPAYTVLTGDVSVRHNRPAAPLLSALQQLGAFAVSSRGDGHAPLLIKGPFAKDKARLDGQDSQPVSGLLIASAYAPHPIELFVDNPGEKPWIDMTLHWLGKLGISYVAQDYSYYRMQGSAKTKGFAFRVPGDLSTAAFPIAAALVTGSSLAVHNIDLDDVQGDKQIIALLQQMGARIHYDSDAKVLHIEKGAALQGARIDVNAFIDALPILAVVGCFAEGVTEIVNAQGARKKESDRIFCIAQQLRKMGAVIEEKHDGLLIYPSELRGAELDAHRDHRIAMSLSVAALAARGPSTIRGVECIAKSYPDFAVDFQKIGAKICT